MVKKQFFSFHIFYAIIIEGVCMQVFRRSRSGL